MNELITIVEENKRQCISAKELHSFLESKQDFTTWIKARIEKYDFVENEDFTFHKFMEGKVWKHDYILKIEMAKELSMVENNEKGKQARRYFIKVEKAFKEQVSSVPMTIEDMMIKQLEEQKNIKSKVEFHDNEILEMKDKIDNQITLDHAQQLKITGAVKKAVFYRCYEISGYKKKYQTTALGCEEMLKEMKKYMKKNSRKFHPAIYKDLKNLFAVPSYRDIKAKDFDTALNYITNWIEPQYVIDKIKD